MNQFKTVAHPTACAALRCLPEILAADIVPHMFVFSQHWAFGAAGMVAKMHQSFKKSNSLDMSEAMETLVKDGCDVSELIERGARFTMSRALLVCTTGDREVSDNPFEPPKNNDVPPTPKSWRWLLILLIIPIVITAADFAAVAISVYELENLLGLVIAAAVGGIGIVLVLKIIDVIRQRW